MKAAFIAISSFFIAIGGAWLFLCFCIGIEVLDWLSRH